MDLLSRIETRSTLLDNTRLKIAYQLAPTRPQDALRVVESMNTFGARRFRPMPTAAWRWPSLHATENWLARSSTRAFEFDKRPRSVSWSHYGDRGVFAAHVVWQAARIGYPDMGLLIDRALAMRRTEDDGSRQRQYQKNTVFMAALLALVIPHPPPPCWRRCRRAARGSRISAIRALRPAIGIKPGVGQPPAGGRRARGRRLAAARTDPHVDLDACGLDQTLDLLTTPAAERDAVLDRYIRAFRSRPRITDDVPRATLSTMRSRVHASTFLLLIGLVLLLSACAPKASERVEGTVLDAAGKPLDKVRVFNCGDGLAMIETRTATDGHFFLQGFGTGRVWLFAQKEGYRFAAPCPAACASDNRLTLAECREPPKAQAAASEPIPLERQQQLAHRLLEKLWADCSGDNRCYWVTRAMGRIDPELALRWAGGARKNAMNGWR